MDAGTVELTAARAEEGGDCNGLNFDPLVLPAGIEPSADPVLHARRAAYAESLRRCAAMACSGTWRLADAARSSPSNP